MEALTQFRSALDLLRTDMMTTTMMIMPTRTSSAPPSWTTSDSSDGTKSYPRDNPASCSSRHQPSLDYILPLLLSVPMHVKEEDRMKAMREIIVMSPHNAFLFYERIFIFDPFMMQQYFLTTSSSSSHPRNNNVGHLLCTCALLFNMGMTCHRLGLSIAGSDQTSYFLSRALGLYQMMISLLTDYEDEALSNHQQRLPSDINQNNDTNDYHPNNPDFSENALFYLLKLALYSNMGHICSHFFMNEEVETCRIVLTQLLLEREENKNKNTVLVLVRTKNGTGFKPE
jgi:hypothetical protein